MLIEDAVTAGVQRAKACAELEISDRTGRHRLERAFRLHVLSSAVRLQPVRAPRTLLPAPRQRPQLRRLGSGSGRNISAGIHTNVRAPLKIALTLVLR